MSVIDVFTYLYIFVLLFYFLLIDWKIDLSICLYLLDWWAIGDWLTSFLIYFLACSSIHIYLLAC